MLLSDLTMQMLQDHPFYGYDGNQHGIDLQHRDMDYSAVIAD